MTLSGLLHFLGHTVDGRIMHCYMGYRTMNRDIQRAARPRLQPGACEHLWCVLCAFIVVVF